MTDEYDAIIVGGGPAGSAAAARLAMAGARVLLIEKASMPRAKLCGEFVTPECFPTLQRLGVLDRLIDAGAQRIARLRLCVSESQIVEVHLRDMSHGFEWALSLTRDRFDDILFQRAREAGAKCLERVAVKSLRPMGRGAAFQVDAASLSDGRLLSFMAPVVIDASGRNSRLTPRSGERRARRRGKRPYAVKAHLEDVEGLSDQVELYSFPQGYGGLSRVEGGLCNLCFIVNEQILRRTGGRTGPVLAETVLRNPIARERLANAKAVGQWLTAGPLAFGRGRLSQDGIISVGDAAGMIDPFTGTGIQIAVRSGEIAAEAVLDSLARHQPEQALETYRARYLQEFSRRMALAGLLRPAALSSSLANRLAGVLARYPTIAKALLRATRAGTVTR